MNHENEILLNRIADEFEAAWQSGRKPDIGVFLKRVEQGLVPRLADLLIPLDIEYRVKAGEVVAADEYRSFVEGAAAIACRALESQAFDPQATHDLNQLPKAGSDDATLTGGTNQTHSNEAIPQTIGPYRLVQRLGAGGMGEVWVAEQTEPVRRRVALKLIKSGIGSKEIIARFEAERQALAVMNHPNIARILDAGTTLDGQPFFVMELVAGKPLTVYCDEDKLSIDQRLKLFTDVCSGVQHAHQKGIIHRDLKPGNIIVGLLDGVPVPKIIDFGLAKAMESTQRLTDQSLFTGIGQVLGTLKYMSPEQASLENLDIDTRADIYALGVVLYELLTGSTPLDDSSIKGQAALKVLELIRDKEPVKPSRKLGSTTEGQKSSITNQRRTDSVRLNRILAGDLDWIVMKALEKDRTRRYESASGFAADIHRYLNSEPVIARPPSVNYRIRKFVRKNRVGVIAASLVTLALVGGIIGTSLGMSEAFRQKRVAENELHEKEKARAAEKAQREMAERTLEFARNGNEILGTVFAGLDPKKAYETTAELRNALATNLEQAIRELEGSAIGNQLEVARMQGTLGRSLLGLGQPDAALQVFSRVYQTRRTTLGPDHPDTISSMSSLAMGHKAMRQIDEALTVLEEALRLGQARLGPEHDITLTCMNNLAAVYQDSGRIDEAIPLLAESLERNKARHGIDDPDTLSVMSNLAMAYHAKGQLDKALPILEETLVRSRSTLGDNHPDTALRLNNLAGWYDAAGRLDKSVPLLEEALEKLIAILGREHEDTITTMVNLATCYEEVGNSRKAVPLLEDAVNMREKKDGPDNPRTLDVRFKLALSYMSIGQHQRAIPWLEATLEMQKDKLGPAHEDVFATSSMLALAYEADEQLDKALPLHELAYSSLKEKLGPKHEKTLAVMSNLAKGYFEAGKIDMAIPLMEENLELKKASLGSDSPEVLMSMNNLAMGYRAAGQLEKSLSLMEECYERRKSILGMQHPQTINSMNNLAEARFVAGQIQNGLELYEETLTASRNILGPEHPDTLMTMSNLGLRYRTANQSGKACELLEDVYRIREQTLGPEHAATLDSMTNLGAVLRDMGELEKASELLEKAFLNVEKRRFQHPRANKIVSTTIEVFEASGQLEKADGWRKKWLESVSQRFGESSDAFRRELEKFALVLVQRKDWLGAESTLRKCLCSVSAEMRHSTG